MKPFKSYYPFVAQTETLLIYGIFLFLIGLTQICITISHQYITQKTVQNNKNIFSLFPVKFTLADIHLWFIYPSSALTIVPFLSCVILSLSRRQILTIVICISSLISFIASSIYIGLLIVYTLECWQAISSSNMKTLPSSTTSLTHLLIPNDESSAFSNFILLITFTLALVQALLSMIGTVISFIWSPCCVNSISTYKPIATTSHYAQTTPHRHETPQSSTLRSVKRQQRPENHRFITTNSTHPDQILNGFLHTNSPIRSHYDDV